MKFLQTKPHVENMNNKYYDLLQTIVALAITLNRP